MHKAAQGQPIPMSRSGTYEPFGTTTVSGTSGNPFQYTGRENDGTGLYYYRTRYYSPRVHRFASEDPIRFYAGPNFYTYVSNRVTRFSDPWGLDPSQRSKFSFSFGYTWGTDGMQCTGIANCTPTTTFPPEFKLGVQLNYNQPPPHLNPLNVNVNIYSHNPTTYVGFGINGSAGTYIYENPNPGPGGQTMLQQGLSLDLGVGAGPPVSISR